MAVYFIVFWTLIHVFGIWNTNRLKEALTHTQNVQGKKHAHLDLADALGADSFLSVVLSGSLQSPLSPSEQKG